MRNVSKLTGAIVAVALSAGSAAAQVTASMTATTTVISSLAVIDAAGVTGQIKFGNLAQGASATTTAASSANAGRFDITGNAGSPLTINYTSLPSVLTATGGQTLSMTSYTACYLQTNANAGCTSQAISVGTPMSGSPALSSPGGLGFVFVGATLGAVASNQVLGAYSGTITISITSP